MPLSEELQSKLSALNKDILEYKELKENKVKRLETGKALLEQSIMRKRGIEAKLKELPQRNHTKEPEPVKKAKMLIKEHEDNIVILHSRIKIIEEEIHILDTCIPVAQRIAWGILLQILPDLSEEVISIITGKALAVGLMYHQITQLADSPYSLFKSNALPKAEEQLQRKHKQEDTQELSEQSFECGA